jgi:hypothetical protein
MTVVETPESTPPSFQRKLESSAFKASQRRWIPASAGMTAVETPESTPPSFQRKLESSAF